MASVVEKPAPIAVRRTPDAALVRRVMSGVAVLGMLTALPGAMLPIWSIGLNLDTRAGAEALLVFAAGATAAVVAAGRLLARGPENIRLLATIAGVVASAALVSISGVYTLGRLLNSLFALGLAVGALWSAESRSLFDTVAAVPTSRSLACFFFGGGATAVCLVLWVSIDVVALPSLFLFLAAIPLLLSLYVWKETAQRHPPGSTAAGDPVWKSLANPLGILFALAVLLHAAAHGAVAYWLAIYVTRKFGFSLGAGLLLQAAYWLSLTSTQVAATRLPPLEKRIRWLVWAVAGCAISCAFLLETADLSGAVVGTLILGVAIGTIQSLTAGWISRRMDWRRPVFFHTVVAVYLTAAMAAAWVVGRLVFLFSVNAVVWAVVGAVLMLFLVLAVLVVEAKLSEKKTALS